MLNQIVHMRGNVNKFRFTNTSAINFCQIFFKLNALLNAIFVFALTPVTAIFPVTKIYASEESKRLDSINSAKNLIRFSSE